MRKLLLIIVMILAAIFYWGVRSSHDVADLSKVPQLESGDLIFETALSNQALAISMATMSAFTHVGIVHKHENGDITVIHAAQVVSETPLKEFVSYGWGQKFTVMRYDGLTSDQRDAIVKDAEHYLGVPYNYLFYMKSERLYCSELPYRVFATEHVPIGQIEKIGDLHVNNAPVHKIFDQRWKSHPACQKPGMNASTCWEAVMKEPIITPVSLANDKHLTTIYSNYIF